MKYMGSKRRISSHILSIILKNRQKDQWYVEPFCGGCNTIDKVEGKRLASDVCPYLIAMWKSLQRGVRFPEVIGRGLYVMMREMYQRGKGDKAMIGWVGYMASFNGRFFEGGYSGHYVKIIGGVRDYVGESIANIKMQIPLLKDVRFECCSYDKLEIPEKSLIYCDPPYEGTKPYSNQIIDYEKFWDWCREKKKEGHDIFISSYEAPEDFKLVWEQRVKNTMHQTNTHKPIEKLFTL